MPLERSRAGGDRSPGRRVAAGHLGQPPSPGGWVASIRHGGGEAAHPATVQFVNSRAFPGCQLHYVL